MAAIVFALIMYAICRCSLENKTTYNNLRKAQRRADGLYNRYEAENANLKDEDGDGIPDVLQLDDSEDSGDESDLDHFESLWDITFRCKTCCSCSAKPTDDKKKALFDLKEEILNDPETDDYIKK